LHRSDVIAGVFLSLLGLVLIFFIVPQQISGSSDYGIAPDVFPLTLLWLFTILSALLAVHRATKWATLEQESILTFANWQFILGAGVFLVAVYFAIDTLGLRWSGPFILATMLFVTGVLTRWPVRSVVLAVLVPQILYHLFWDLFRVPLP
jgi:hypothetical protein